MKVLLFCLLSICFFNFAEAQTSKGRYPVIVIANGKVELVEGTKVRPLKINESLKEKALIRTGDKAQVKIEFSPKTSLLLLENSEIKIPFITWEDGSVEQVELSKGRMHFFMGEGSGKTVITQLSRDSLKSGQYVYTYERLAPKVDVMVLAGDLDFRGLENEESIQLKTGERASFIGVLEAGEVVYDTLLKGRKVARGHLSKVQKIPAADMLEATKQAEIKKVVVKKAAPAKRTTEDICEKPFAKLNQCVWRCEKNSKKAKNCDLSAGAICVRERCNANGLWAEKTELSGLESKCSLNDFVNDCDY